VLARRPETAFGQCAEGVPRIGRDGTTGEASLTPTRCQENWEGVEKQIPLPHTTRVRDDRLPFFRAALKGTQR
jgi:hypothetical protein